jgi:hypothetical protein
MPAERTNNIAPPSTNRSTIMKRNKNRAVVPTSVIELSSDEEPMPARKTRKITKDSVKDLQDVSIGTDSSTYLISNASPS